MELPGVTQLVDGQVQVSDIREVDIIDLLGVILYRRNLNC
jgi:FlaA1/EpsC-like NDP-sugar epimerase